MALTNYNGRFCEQDFENALVQMFVDNGWEYLFGDNIERSSGTEVLIADDIRSFIEEKYTFLNPDEVSDIVNKISLAGGETQFATMHNIYTMLVDGITFTTADGTPHIINFIDYDNG